MTGLDGGLAQFLERAVLLSRCIALLVALLWVTLRVIARLTLELTGLTRLALELVLLTGLRSLTRELLSWLIRSFALVLPSLLVRLYFGFGTGLLVGLLARLVRLLPLELLIGLVGLRNWLARWLTLELAGLALWVLTRLWTLRVGLGWVALRRLLRKALRRSLWVSLGWITLRRPLWITLGREVMLRDPLLWVALRKPLRVAVSALLLAELLARLVTRELTRLGCGLAKLAALVRVKAGCMRPRRTLNLW